MKWNSQTKKCSSLTGVGNSVLDIWLHLHCVVCSWARQIFWEQLRDILNTITHHRIRTLFSENFNMKYRGLREGLAESKGHTPSTCHGWIWHKLLLLNVNFAVEDIIHSQSNKLVMGGRPSQWVTQNLMTVLG